MCAQYRSIMLGVTFMTVVASVAGAQSSEPACTVGGRQLLGLWGGRKEWRSLYCDREAEFRAAVAGWQLRARVCTDSSGA